MYITKCTFLNFAPEGRTETLQLTYFPQMLAVYISSGLLYGWEWSSVSSSARNLVSSCFLGKKINLPSKSRNFVCTTSP